MSAFSRRVLRHRVIVNLVTGQAIDGVLLGQDGPLLIVANATLLEPDAEPARLDGQAVIERDKVAFIQSL